MNTDDTYLIDATWRHRKTGEEYTILGFSTNEEDGMTMVHYRKYDHTSTTPIWTRSMAAFFDGRFVRLFPGYKGEEVNRTVKKVMLQEYFTPI